jgi:hypothetical protein
MLEEPLPRRAAAAGEWLRLRFGQLVDGRAEVVDRYFRPELQAAPAPRHAHTAPCLARTHPRRDGRLGRVERRRNPLRGCLRRRYRRGAEVVGVSVDYSIDLGLDLLLDRPQRLDALTAARDLGFSRPAVVLDIRSCLARLLASRLTE